MNRTQGFTVIELLVALVLVLIIGTIALVQKNDLDASTRDQKRKISVNAMYYGLKEGYFKQNKSYPSTISKENLLFIDPASFVLVGNDKEYTIHYKGLNCEANACADFLVTTKLEKESEYKRGS